MRHQPQPIRSHSYLLHNKENKENQNILNIKPTKPLKTKLSHPLNSSDSNSIISHHHNDKKALVLEKKTSRPESDSTAVSVFGKLQLSPPSIKHQYSTHTGANYSRDILSHYCEQSSQCKDFLQPHSITSSLRAKMVDWMIEVLSSYKMSEDSFFRALKIMDSFLQKTSTKQQIKDLHLIGVASMFSACKYEQIYPIKLDTMYDRISRKKFKREEILEKESELLTSLNFRMEEVNVYDILKNVAFELKLDITQQQKLYLDQIILYLGKMSLFSYQLAQQDTKLLASAVFFIALKTLQQVEPSLKPEEHLHDVGMLLSTTEEKIIEVSRKVLELAKNFSTVYPNLGNLKKFNKFQYKKKSTARIL